MTLLGKTVGTIRLVECLGTGGMAEVYLGEDQKLERQVAVKVMRPEHRMDAVNKARLTREAQVLSKLEHPNICRVYDHLEADGDEFIVLELVRGSNLRELMARQLSSAEKAKIADQVIQALVAAHSMSIVHRDLKPENIMVTPESVVKVLDFGLARTVPPNEQIRPSALDVEAVGAAEGSAEAPGFLTADGEILGTPRYMSPEQARGESATAASDLYSFGLLLQELYSGVPPYGDEHSVATIRHRARWGDTEPSTTIDAHLAALIDDLTAVLPQDRPSAVAVAQRLEWIRSKPKRRMRRIAATSLLIVLVAAAIVSTAGFVKARRAQAKAEAAERSAREAQAAAEAVNDFLSEMLASADPAEQGIDVKVIDVLDRAAEQVAPGFADQPVRQAAVLQTLGRTYHALGAYDRAIELFERAAELRETSAGSDAPETLAARHYLAVAIGSGGHMEEAEGQLRQIIGLRTEIHGARHPLTLESDFELAKIYRRQRRFEEAGVLLDSTLEGYRETFGQEHLSTLVVVHELARVESRLGKVDSALEHLRTVLGARERILGETHPDTISSIQSLAILLSWTNQHEEAEPLYSRAVELTSRVLGEDHPETLQAMGNLGYSLYQQGKHAEAEQLMRTALSKQRQVVGAAHPITLRLMSNLAGVLSEQGKTAEAEALLRERIASAREEYGADHRITLENISVLAHHLFQANRLAEAERLYRQVFAARRKLFGDQHPATKRSVRDFASLLRSSGRESEAAEIEALVADPPAS